MTFEETDNHALNTYDQGDTGWEHSTDMETIEQRLVVRDLEANRTNYTAYDDATFIASDTGAVYDGDGANWNEATRGLSSLDAEQADVEYLNRANAGVVAGGDGGTLGMQTAQSNAYFHSTFRISDLLSGYDPDIYHADHFDDNLYRLTITDTEANANTDLYTASDPFDASTYALEAQDIFNSGTSAVRVNDHVRLPDGRWAIYTTTDDADETDVRVGDDLTNTSLVGQVLTEPDVGTIRAPDGKIHIYAEDSSVESGPQATPVILHFTTPENDLTTATLQGTAIDVTNRDWDTGDCELIRVGGAYYMFMDRKAGAYNVAVARSTNLTDWTIIQDSITKVKGGDPTLATVGNRLVMICEQSEADGQDLGVHEVQFESVDQLAQARSRGFCWEFTADTADGFDANTSGSGVPATLRPSNGDLRLETGTTSGSKSNLSKYFLTSTDVPTWRERRTLYGQVIFNETSETSYISTGALDIGATTIEHVGFGMVNGDIIGTTSDGTTESTTTLVASALSGRHRLRAEYYPDDRVDFYVDGEFAGDLTTNLPSPIATANADRIFMAAVGNGTTTNNTMDIEHIRVGQAPGYHGR